MKGYLTEYVSICSELETKLPQDIIEIAITINCPIRAYDTHNHSLDKKVGIIIALREEFDVLFAGIDPKPEFNKGLGEYYYTFHIKSNIDQTTYDCVASLIGGMGTTKAGIVCERLVAEYNPNLIINIGIAGGMNNEVRLGDIVIADQIDEYLTEAKATNSDNKDAFDLKLSGDVYKTSRTCTVHSNHFQLAYASEYDAWKKSCMEDHAKVIDNETYRKLIKDNLLREHPNLYVGHIASGPIVAGTECFTSWLNSVTENILQ